MFSHQGCCKSWPGGEIASTNGFDPYFLYWAEDSFVQVLDDVGLFCVFVYVVDLVDMSRIGRGSEGW